MPRVTSLYDRVMFFFFSGGWRVFFDHEKKTNEQSVSFITSFLNSQDIHYNEVVRE